MMTKHPKRTIIILCIFICAVAIVLCTNGWITGRQSNNDDLNVHFIDVGQGNATLLERNGHYAIIDGGDADSSFRLTVYLQLLGVKKLDYVIATHYDTDHLYGLVNIIYSFEVDNILAPEYSVNTKIYKSFMNALKVKGQTYRQPELGEKFDFQGVSMLCVAPYENEYQNENDNSIGMKISCGDIDFLICGDATYRSEMDMLSSGEDLQSEVYLVSHHGSASSSTSEFLAAIKPKISIISVGADNDYGHPTKRVLKRLRATGCEIYRTDQLGDIIISTDGKNLSVRCNGKDSVIGQESDTGYIVNMRTEKFHRDDCEAVGEMYQENRLSFRGTREQLIELGYEPCRLCNP